MNKFRVGEFFIEPPLNLVSGNSHSTRVEPKVMQVLLCLCDRAGEVVAKEEIIRTVWADTFVTDDVLTRSVSELRKVFGDASKEPRYIQTIPRSGYRLIAPVEYQKLALPNNSLIENPQQRTFASTKIVWAMLILILLLGSVAAVFYLNRTTDKKNSIVRIVPFTTFTGREDHAAFSPDGNQIAFAWNGEKEDNVDIYVKSVGGAGPLRLTTNPATDSLPTWSPDGQRIAFVRSELHESTVYVISVLGTSPERLLFKLSFPPEKLSWSPDGKLIATNDLVSKQSVILLFLPETGERKYLTAPPPGKSLGDSTPAFSPDGKNVAFVRHNTPITADVYVVSITGGEPRRITHDNAQYFFHDVTVGGLAWTADGKELVFSSTRGGIPGLWRVAVSGGDPERLAMGGDDTYYPTISATGNRLAYTQVSSGTSAYRLDLSNSNGQPGTQTKLFGSSRRDGELEYSPDGTKISFDSSRSGNLEIWICNSDGTNLTQLTNFGKGTAGTPRFSPDSKWIAFDYRGTENGDVYVASVLGGVPRRLTTEASDDSLPSWSHTGTHIYFQSSRGGEGQIWKMPLEGGPAIQLTRQGGFNSFESQDGKYLYYSKDAKNGVWRVPVEGGQEELVLEKPNAGTWGQWTLVSDNLYFVSYKSDGSRLLNVFNVANKRTSEVRALGKGSFLSYLAVSPDQRSIVFLEQNTVSGDIMLVENFR